MKYNFKWKLENNKIIWYKERILTLNDKIAILNKQLGFIQKEINFILKDVKPALIHVYYISVQNQEQNLKFYHKWVELWLAERENTLNFILEENGNKEVFVPIPEPINFMLNAELIVYENKFSLIAEKEVNMFDWLENHLNILNYSSSFITPSIIPSIPNAELVIYENKFSLILAEKIHEYDFNDILGLNIFKEWDYKINHVSHLEIIFDQLISLKNILENINIYKGFVQSTNIYSSEYPIINHIAVKVLSKSSWDRMDDLNRTKVYTWIINILMLNMNKLTNKVLNLLNDIDVPMEYKDKWYDLVSKYSVLKEWSYNLLDNSIKQHLVKRNPLLIQENIAGFDTEYVPLEFGKNKLISAQLSICGVTKLRIPLLKEYKFEGVNTRTGETYIKMTPNFDQPLLIENWIDVTIKEIRNNLFNNHDKLMMQLASFLAKNNDKIEAVVKLEDCILFKFNKLPIINKFIIPAENEELIINMESLINIIVNSNKKSLNNQLHSIIKFISRINLKYYNNNLEAENKICIPWNNDTLVQKDVEDIILSNNLNERLSKENQKKAEKLEIQGINFNYNNDVYLYAHYNSADITMLRNWDKILEKEIDILKKSFSSLISPVNICGKKVYLRDTVLLSSAAAASLEAVGKMHKLDKGKLSQIELQNMELFKARNPVKFKAYAMQDSLITLIHALFMIDFGFGLGSLKNASTLGSLSSLYVKNRWKADEYRGYQLNVNYPLGDVRSTLTPRGITSVGKIAEDLPLFIGSFRGGRNECFTYGIDKETIWYDYDLTSCYSTVMSMCGNPMYEGREFINVNEVVKKINNEKSVEAAEAEEKRFIMQKTMQKIREGFKNEVFLGEEEKSPDQGTESPISVKDGPEKIFSLKEEINKISVNEISEEESLSKLTPVVLSLCGQPDYSNMQSVSYNTPIDELDLLNSYSAFRIKFKLPETIKYPPIPVNLNKDITIYPLEGESLITGLEYKTAKMILDKELKSIAVSAADFIHLNNTFFVNIISGSYIPFKRDYEGELIYPPFLTVIDELQSNRRKHPKKSALERIYKDLGNMLYGKVVSGISNKRKYDARTRLMKAMMGNTEIGNPIIGTWITGFVRSLLAELLNATYKLGGLITAVTTDGFVTNIENLEEKIITSADFDPNTSLLQIYRNIRQKLSNDPSALEIKTNVKGIIQWTTRGQLSIDNSQIPIAAMTGFQKYQFDHKTNVKSVQNVLNKGNSLLFLQKQLSGALDSYTKENLKNVSMTSALRKFRTIFDTKRIIIDNSEFRDSKPYTNIQQAGLHRTLIGALKQSVYSEQYSTKLIPASRSYKEEFIKYFVRFIVEVSKNINFEKFIWVNLLHYVLPEISKKYLLNLFNDAIIFPGIVLSKLIYTNETNDILNKIFDMIIQYKQHEIFKNSRTFNIIPALKDKFSNFVFNPTSLILYNPKISASLIIYSDPSLEFEREFKENINIFNLFKENNYPMYKIYPVIQFLIANKYLNKDLNIIPIPVPEPEILPIPIPVPEPEILPEPQLLPTSTLVTKTYEFIDEYGNSKIITYEVETSTDFILVDKEEEESKYIIF